jgi:hypothetical protein
MYAVDLAVFGIWATTQQGAEHGSPLQTRKIDGTIQR